MLIIEDFQIRQIRWIIDYYIIDIKKQAHFTRNKFFFIFMREKNKKFSKLTASTELEYFFTVSLEEFSSGIDVVEPDSDSFLFKLCRNMLLVEASKLLGTKDIFTSKPSG